MQSITRFEDITSFNVSYRPKDHRPALWDCPKVIRDAAFGQFPKPKLWSKRDYFKLGLPILVAVGVMQVAAGMMLVPLTNSLLPILAIGLIAMPLAAQSAWRHHRRTYEREKEIFDAYRSQPGLYRDEVFKAAVGRLPLLDFHGKHLTTTDKAQIGRYEQDVIAHLERLGIRQELTIANRGRPFLIHQYEVRELGWGKRADGSSKNFVLDIAILWPERRIKFNIEIDGETHQAPARVRHDMRRDEILTARGWFVRRFNHRFLSNGIDAENVQTALSEVIKIIYFFAKYADERPLEWDSRLIAWMAQRSHRMALSQPQ